MIFIDLDRELNVLEQAWQNGRAVFGTVAGRRRVGKSRLLSRYLHQRPHVYLTGTLQTAHVHLVDASREIYRVTQDPLLAHQDLTSWEALLDYIGIRARKERLGFVLDEFSYFCDALAPLPSLVQRWWDRVAQDTQVLLILADSHLAYMDRLVQGDQPLYGRRTHELRLTPFDYFDAARFFPNYSAEDRIRAYGILGGMPAYLGACNPARSLAENLRSVVFGAGASLRHEPDYLFAQERSIKDPVRYRAVLRSIAEGHTQPNDIAISAGYGSPADITGILQRLQELRLVERIVPIGVAPRGRISRYALTDPFLAFWFRFVQPVETLLEQGLDGLITGDLQQNDWLRVDEFVSRPQGPWESACASYLWRAQHRDLLDGVRFDSLGCWWEGRGATESREVDLVATRGNHTTLLGSCKWRRSFTKLGDLHELKLLGHRLGADHRTRFVLFSRSGFDPNLIEVARSTGVMLVTPEVMFQPQLSEYQSDRGSSESVVEEIRENR